MIEITVYSSDVSDEDLDAVREECPECSNDELWEFANVAKNDCLRDEMDNLNVELPNEVVIFGTLGLWNGRVPAGCVRKANLNEIFKVGYHDSFDIYVDDRDDIVIHDRHHDGTNVFVARMAKSNMDHEDIRDMLDDYASGDHTSNYVEHHTLPLGPYVRKVYGL